MNKNIFKINVLLLTIVVSGVECSENMEATLKRYEKKVDKRISYFNVLQNMFHLPDYVDKIDGDLALGAEKFFSDMNSINDKSPLYARKKVVESFYDNGSKEAIKNACVAKLRKMCIGMIAGALAITGIGYYFYSKDK